MPEQIIVKFKKIKKIYIRVRNGVVYISCPYKTSKEKIQKIIKDNYVKIILMLSREANRKAKYMLHIGDNITILGKNYSIVKTDFKIQLTDSFIFVKENEDIRKQVMSLLKETFYKYMYDLTKKNFALMNFTCPFPTIKVNDAKSKYGSYSRKHCITYSFSLMFKDYDMINYVVIHELAHIIEFNHHKEFYAIIEKYLPNYKSIERKLKGR